MTYDEYWYGDPLMVGAFRKAERIRQERVDSEFWLQGLYMMQAIESTIGNVFLKKGSQPLRYPELPFIAERNERVAKEKQTEREEREKTFAKAWMLQLCELGKDWGKKP